MVEPSESARRIESVLKRFGVQLEGELAKPDIMVQKKAMGMILPRFVDRFKEEIAAADLSANSERILKLKAKQLNDIGERMAELPPGEQFENVDLGLLAVFLETTMVLMGTILGKDYREQG